jgi:hypothetical protein
MQKIDDAGNDSDKADQLKLDVMADQLGVDLKKTTDEEKRSLLSFLNKSIFGLVFKRRR